MNNKMSVPKEYLEDLQKVISGATESDYLAIAKQLVNSGANLPDNVPALHKLIIQTAINNAPKQQEVSAKFQPLLDLDEYKIDQELHSTVRELAEVKVGTLAEIFEQTYVDDFDKWISDSAPLLTTKDESLQRLTLRLMHQVKTERINTNREYRRAVLVVIQNTIRYWVVLSVFSVFASVYANLSVINGVAYAGAVSAVFSPVGALLDKKKE